MTETVNKFDILKENCEGKKSCCGQLVYFKQLNDIVLSSTGCPKHLEPAYIYL